MITRFTLEELDRAIYNKLRLALVAGGFLPDILAQANATAYKAAKEAIVAGGGHIIEVFGVGSTLTRDEIKASHITVNMLADGIGNIGGGPVKRHEQYTDTNGDAKFRKKLSPDSTRDLIFEIRVHTDKTKHFREVRDLLYRELGSRSYLSVYNSDLTEELDKKFLLVSNGGSDMSTAEWIEYLFRFTAMDIWLEVEDKEIGTNISPLTSVEFNINLLDRAIESVDDLPAATGDIITIEPKYFNIDCKDQIIHFAQGIKWRLPYGNLFPENCGDIEVKSVQNEQGTEFVGDVNTTINNNTGTKVVTVDFQQAEQGFIILGVSTP